MVDGQIGQDEEETDEEKEEEEADFQNTNAWGLCSVVNSTKRLMH